MRIDRNARLCSKDVQRRLKSVKEVLTRESLHYCIRHNLIESSALDEALKSINELITDRTSQLYHA